MISSVNLDNYNLCLLLSLNKVTPDGLFNFLMTNINNFSDISRELLVYSIIFGDLAKYNEFERISDARIHDDLRIFNNCPLFDSTLFDYYRPLTVDSEVILVNWLQEFMNKKTKQILLRTFDSNYLVLVFKYFKPKDLIDCDILEGIEYTKVNQELIRRRYLSFNNSDWYFNQIKDYYLTELPSLKNLKQDDKPWYYSLNDYQLAYLVGINFSSKSCLPSRDELLLAVDKVLNNLDDYYRKILKFNNNENFTPQCGLIELNHEYHSNTHNVLQEKISTYLPFDIYMIREGKVIYRFTRDEFSQLLIKGENFYNRQKIKKKDIKGIQRKLRFAEKYGLPDSAPADELFSKITVDNNGDNVFKVPDLQKFYQNSEAKLLKKLSDIEEYQKYFQQSAIIDNSEDSYLNFQLLNYKPVVDSLRYNRKLFEDDTDNSHKDIEDNYYENDDDDIFQ